MRLWKNARFIAFVIALVTVAGGFVAWNWYHPEYRARARLLIDAEPPRVLFRTVENGFAEHANSAWTAIVSGSPAWNDLSY